MTPRDLAREVLSIQDQGPGFSERYLDNAFRKHRDLTERDRAFATHLVRGVIRWRLRLDWTIEQVLGFPFKKIDKTALAILRIALYQILFMDRVPDSAAVNEAVKQAKKLCRDHVTRSINGILREICRHKDRLSLPERQGDEVAYMSVYYSYPVWLVKKWLRDLGRKTTELLLDAGNRIPGIVIRANRLKTDIDSLINRLGEEGVQCRRTAFFPDSLKIERLGRPLERIPSFKEGLFQVQGEAAQVCSYLLSPQPDEYILDLCAGLGGKTGHLAELTGGKGKLVAFDINHGRLSSLSRNSRRLGVDCISSVVGDATRSLPFSIKQTFDSILIDAPCSGLGTIGRHPDIKWARDEGDIERLSDLQTDILSAAEPVVKKGGKILYLTCTISVEENEGVVRRFLERHQQMEMVDLANVIPEWGRSLIAKEGFFKTYPHLHDMDGFFGALFSKKRY